MKITFSGCDFSSSSGPNSFARRLAKQFVLMGHEVVSPDVEHDVWLCFIQPTSYPCRKAKKVARFDGIWFSPETYRNNSSLKQLYDHVDDVVIQTQHDRKFITKFFGERRNVHVIGNGIDLGDNNLLFDKDPSTLSFVCSSAWHGQKRLRENILLFQHVRKTQTKNCYLTVLGSNITQEIYGLDEKHLENVYLAGHKSHKECLMHYRTADWMIHLAFADHFPNVLAESLSQLCPVIYASDGGGVSEVVRNNGVVVHSSKEFNYELCNYENPAKEGYILDIESFVLPQKIDVNPLYLDIKTIAKQYIEVFEK